MSDTELIGAGDFPYPVSISRDDFQGATIEADAFLFKNHRFTSVDSLIKDLTQLSNSLSQELLDLVNNDYNDFIELGKSINGGLDLINSIKVDLKSFNAELLSLKTSLISSRDTASQALHHRKLLLELKSTIKLVLLLNEQVNNFETLLAVEPRQPTGAASDTKATKATKTPTGTTGTSDIKATSSNNGTNGTEPHDPIAHWNLLTSLYLSLLKISQLVGDQPSDFLDKSLRPRVSSLQLEFKLYLDNEASQASPSGKDHLRKIYGAVGLDQP